jgi:hypothetical protein
MRRLEKERELDPPTFDEAAALAYKDSIEIAAQHPEKGPADANDASRWGNNFVCSVVQQGYGPQGVIWAGAWIRPGDDLDARELRSAAVQQGRVRVHEGFAGSSPGSRRCVPPSAKLLPRP